LAGTGPALDAPEPLAAPLSPKAIFR